MTQIALTDQIAAREPTLTRNRAIDRFRRHRLAVAGMALIVFLLLVCFAGPYALPFDDLFIDVRNRFSPPFVSVHILGTDPLGRDHLARLMMAGRISLSIGLAAMLMATCLGTVVGAVAGYYGGVIGAALVRLVDEHADVISARAGVAARRRASVKAKIHRIAILLFAMPRVRRPCA